MDQDLIIRNSKSLPNNAGLNNAEDDLEPSTMRDDEFESTSTSIHVSRDTSLSIVRLIESSEGKYMLDFGLDSDPLVITSFSDNNHIKEKSDDCKIFIEDGSLKHLEVYAALASVGSSIIKGEELDLQPSSDVSTHSLHLLPDNVQQTVLHTLLPLEKLFSWSTLTSAREEGLLRWKDIRLILSEVKRIVPFIAPNSDGLIFRHIIQTHVTFHQFVSFAKIVEGCLQRLPDVKVKVYQSSTLSIDIQLTSDQNCTVCIGCLPSAQQSTPPSAQQLQECPEDFVSWECIQLVAGESKIVRLEDLKHETVYDMYTHLSRPSSEFPVESTNADVVNSHLTVETQGFHLIDIFPVFESMTKEEQKVELLASTQDKSVRLKAQADGLIIPGGGDEEQNDYDSETWRVYIDWWKDRLGVRYDFCMRELMFASKNQEVRSFARRQGIVMSHAISKDQSKREQWARAFGSWYHNHKQEPADADSHIQLSTDAVQCQANSSVQTLNLPRSEIIDESKVGSLRPRFQNKTRKAEVKIDDACNDSLGEALVLQSITFPQPKVPPSTSPTIELCSTHNESEHVPVVSSEPNSLEPTPDSCMPPKDHHNETKTTPHAQVSDTCKEELPMPPNKPSKSRLTIGVVGNVVGSFRHRFLRRLSSRIDTCLALTRPKTPSSLRGIALFRAKVRLVMLLQKVSNKPFSSISDVDIFSDPQRDTRSAKSTPSTLMNEEEEDDDDSVLMEKARDHCDDRLSRNVFRTIRAWVQNVVEQRAREVAEKRAQEEKTLAAVQVFQSLLLRKCFRSFVEAVKATKENAEKDTVEEAEDEVPSKNEVEYMCVDEDDDCEFTSHWNTNRETLLRRINTSSDSGALIDPILLQHGTNRSTIKFLDDETLSCMRRAKRAGASNLYDVPTSLLRFDDPTEERDIHWSRKQEIVRGISPFA